MSHPLHDEPADLRDPQKRPALGGDHGTHHLPSPQEVHSQLEKVVEQLSERFPQASSMLAEDGADVLAFTGFPGAHWSRCGPIISGASEQGDQAQDRCGGHLPEPSGGASAHRSGTC